MPITAELHDGRRLEFPDGTDPAVVQATVRKVLAGGQAPKEAGGTGQVLKDLSGAVRGAGSIGATLMAPFDYAEQGIERLMGAPARATSINAKRRQDMTDALASMGANPESLVFKGSQLATEVGGTLGVGGVLGGAAARAGAAPAFVNALQTAGMRTGAQAATSAIGRLADLGVRTGAGAAVGGASAGLVNPEDAGAGAVVGGALPGGMQALGKVGGAIGSMVRPNINNPALAQKAIQQYGIPLGAADISASPITRAARSVLNDSPFVGGIGTRQGEKVQAGFNRAVGQTFGANAESLTPQVLDAAKKTMGAEFDRLWNRNVLQYDAPMFTELQRLRGAAAKLAQGDSARLASWIDDIESKMVPDAAGNLTLPGDVANRLQSKLREQAERASGFLAEDLGDLRKAMLDGFKRSVSPKDAQALTANMGKYRAFKTVAPMLSSAEAGVAGRTVGDVPAGLLPQAVRKSYGENIAQSPFADLTQIGSQYVADRVARTGGGPRALVQNSALAGALAGGAVASPALAAAAIPTAAAIQKLLGSPTLARALVNQSGGQQNAIQALLANPELQALIMRGAPIAWADR